MTTIYMTFCKAFNRLWDKNLNEYIENNNMRFDNNLRVVYSKEGKMKEVPPFSDDALKYFYLTFNGPVCDEIHWQGFKECMTHVYQKNGFIQDFEKNYAVFREYWDIHKFNLNLRSKEELKGYRIFVVYNRDLWMYEITPTALECFIKAFNGIVCDYAHWRYFMRCLSGAERMTGIKEGDFTYIGKVNPKY